ncbi:ER lumen protein-retaining receptor 3-like [Condylostylus longicornis]|uniref:ER lumen protein-retaining receptor 3-like n=1 Tax=Condylostylus longicornis TaxID=2530218 RepID=UPI00244E4861|nr:ER lumen protein-retaining receptor 3-like [Condylostylus longicornis]
MEKWLFIIGYLIQVVGSLLLLVKVWSKKSVYGLSSDTQICFLISTLSRIVWSMDTRLVETYLAYAELASSTVVTVLLCFSVWKFRHTTTKEAWWPLRSMVLGPIAFVLAVLFHPGSATISLQVLVAFTMYIEAMALLPQLYLMRKMIEVEPLTSHYVGILVLSRIVRLAFWFSLFMQGEHFIGLFVADLLHTLLAGDYLYIWCRKLRTGGALIYKF